MVNDIFFKNIEITEGTFPVSIIRGFEMKMKCADLMAFILTMW